MLTDFVTERARGPILVARRSILLARLCRLPRLEFAAEGPRPHDRPGEDRQAHIGEQAGPGPVLAALFGGRCDGFPQQRDEYGWIAAYPFCTKVYGDFSFQSRSRFLGVGPRLGIDGHQPLGGSWVFDYLGGVAVLFGDRSFSATQMLSATSTGGAFSTTPATSLNQSGAAAVFNLDAQLGISYWFTPNFKMSASYRFDGYWGALKMLQANGDLGNQDRFYYGPMVRATLFFF
jgi:hypothetical protein